MSLHSPEPRAPLGWKTVLVLALLIFSYLFINTAWVAEDAYITFRSVDQLLAGNGPVWNLGERVQVYTHPLWYGLLALTTGLGLPSYWGALLLSGLCLIGVLALLFHLARRLERSVSKGNASEATGRNRTASLLLGLLLLLSLSRAFIDYSSSGLENPLLHLLLLAYLAVYLSDQPPAKRFALTTFIYGLLFLTRPDGIILVTPTSIYLWLQMLKARQPWLKPALLALSPAIAWELFSLIYYGSLVPNTALAKVNLGYPAAVLHRNAVSYLLVNGQLDPLTLGLILLALLLALTLGLRRAQRLPLLLALGLTLQLAYLFHIGADYMLGRFLSAAALLAVVILLLCLARTPITPANALAPSAKRFPRWTLAGGFLLLALLFSPNYRPGLNYDNDKIIRGIADERGYYFQGLGLLPLLFKNEGQSLADDYRVWNQEFEGKHFISCLVGMSSWAMPLDAQIIDPLALTDPFLARLPAYPEARVGHYERTLPPGYIHSRVQKQNLLAAPALAALYEDVNRVTRGEALLSGARLAAIWRLNTGHYRHIGHQIDPWDLNLRELGVSDEELQAAAQSLGSRRTACFRVIPLASFFPEAP